MQTILYRDGSSEIKENEAVFVNGPISLKHEVVVRLIKESGGRKYCMAEETFDEIPSKQQIVWCLMKYPDANFAVVTDRYSIDDEFKLPFD